MTDVDIAVIGGGPAGIAAATTAAEHGASVTLIDEQPSPGGQIYRNLSVCNEQRAALLGQDYTYGRELLSRIDQSDVNYINGATVWSVTERGVVTYSQHHQAKQLQASAVIIATGALERPYPIPGWTLPGVMTAGAAQILYKTSGVIVNKPILVGTGPLLYAVTSQLLAAGAEITAIVDTVGPKNFARALPAFPFSSVNTIMTGLSYLAKIKKAGIPHYRNCQSIEMIGTDQVKSVRFRCKGRVNEIDAECVLLHQGVVPNTQLSRSVGIEHKWHKAQRCFHPVTDSWGATSVPSIRIAGDGSGIGGAINAEHQGSVVALGALAELKKITEAERDKLAQHHLKTINRSKKLRLFLDKLYEPPTQCYLPADNTIICRCEEVTAGEIRALATQGCTGPNQTKAFSRCGMGPCQGRYCGNTVTEILAAAHKQPQDDIGYYRIRSPIKPVTLQELASLDHIHRDAT